MFGSYSVINVIVLLNMLIAMMSNSYQIISVSIFAKIKLLNYLIKKHNIGFKYLKWSAFESIHVNWKISVKFQNMVTFT